MFYSHFQEATDSGRPMHPDPKEDDEPAQAVSSAQEKGKVTMKHFFPNICAHLFLLLINILCDRNSSKFETLEEITSVYIF